MVAEGKTKECLRCALGDHSRARRPDGIRHEATQPVPPASQIEVWVLDSVCEATDGCVVEPDGRCPHGHVSWLRQLGVM